MKQRQMALIIGTGVVGLLLCCVLACVVGWSTGIVQPYWDIGIERGYTTAIPAITSGATPRRPATATVAPPQRATVTPVSPTATPAYSPVQSDEIALTMRNLSPRDICAILVSPTESGTWGERNLLLAPLATADSITVRFAATELYDVLLVGCDETPMGSFAELATGQSYTLNVGEGGDEAQIRLANQGTMDVCVVIIVPAGTDVADVRIADLLGANEVVAAGEARWLFVPPGAKDMLALDCDGNTLSHRQGRELAVQEYTWYVPDEDSPTPAAETLNRHLAGRGAGHPAPLPQKDTPPPTPVKPLAPPTPSLPEPTAPPPTVVPATSAPSAPANPTPTTMVTVMPTPSTVILLPETGYMAQGWYIRDPRLLLAPWGLLGLGLVLSGLGGLLNLHPWCWLGFHSWVAARTSRREGRWVYVPHTCLDCGRRRTFKMRAPTPSTPRVEEQPE